MRDATKQLRDGLTKRGVEYEVDDAKTVRVTRWRAYGDWVSFIEYDNGDTKFCIDARRLTPEQAIAVTLGPGTCEMDVLTTGDCADYECHEYIMHCNCCGHEFGHVLYNEDGDVWMNEVPNFCPNCSAKVVDQ